MEPRIAVDQGDRVYTIDGITLVAPGEPGELALLGLVETDEVIGGDAFEVTPSGDMMARVGGVTYAVGLAEVRHTGGSLCEVLLLFGVPTEHTFAKDTPEGP
jgi:hypothetical protein